MPVSADTPEITYRHTTERCACNPLGHLRSPAISFSKLMTDDPHKQAKDAFLDGRILAARDHLSLPSDSDSDEEKAKEIDGIKRLLIAGPENIAYALERADDPVLRPSRLGFFCQVFYHRAANAGPFWDMPTGGDLARMWRRTCLIHHSEDGLVADQEQITWGDTTPTTVIKFNNGKKHMVQAARQAKLTGPITVPIMPAGDYVLAKSERALRIAKNKLIEDLNEMDRVVCITWTCDKYRRLRIVFRGAPGKDIAKLLKGKAVLEGTRRLKLKIGDTIVSAKRGYLALSVPASALPPYVYFECDVPDLGSLGVNDRVFETGGNLEAFKDWFASW